MNKILKRSLLCFLLFFTSIANAQFHYEVSCKNATDVLQPKGSAYYTASGTGSKKDVVGDGWLRLTDATNNLMGYVIMQEAYPSDLGVMVEFDFMVYGGATSWADGFSVFLIDGKTTPEKFIPGNSGGGLGYLPNPDLTTGKRGAEDGFIGIGLDEYGNFLNYANKITNVKNNVTLVGPAPSYPYITYKKLPTGYEIPYSSATTVRPTNYYRRVLVKLDPTPDGKQVVVNVAMKNLLTGTYNIIIQDQKVPYKIPPTLRLGFAGVTGGLNAVHEVRNVIVKTSEEFSVFKKIIGQECLEDKGEIEIQSIVTNGRNAIVSNIDVFDTIPANFIIQNTSIVGGTFKDKAIEKLGDGRTVIKYSGLVLNPYEEMLISYKGQLNSTIPNNGFMETSIAANGKYTITSKQFYRATAIGSLNPNEIISIREGESQNLGVSFSGTYIPSFKWEQYNTTSFKWESIGVNTSTYTTPSLSFINAPLYKYRCVVTSPVGTCEHFVYFTLGKALDNLIEDVDCSIIAPDSPWKINGVKSKSTEIVHSLAQPYVGDVDGDGKLEVVVTNEIANTYLRQANQLIVLDQDLNVKYKITVPTMRVYTSFPIALFKPKNGVPLIIIAAQDGYLYAYKAQNSTKASDYVWKSSSTFFSGTVDGSLGITLVVGDMNNDGVAEVYAYDKIFNAETGVLLANLPAGGRALKQLNFGESDLKTTMPVLADIDNNGTLEIVAGNTVYNVNITNTKGTTGNTVTILNQLKINNVLQKDGFTSVADIDLDGFIDVVVIGTEGTAASNANVNLYIWTPVTGNLLGNSELIRIKGDGGSRAFIGDMDNDGYPEVAFTYVKNIVAYRYNPANQQIEQKWTQATTDASGATTLSMFDFNLDGQVELVYRDETDLRIVDGNNGTDRYKYPCFSATHTEYPVIVDFDGDGHADILVSGAATAAERTSKVNIYRFSENDWAPARKVWNQHAYDGISINEDLTVPAYQISQSTVFPGLDGVLGTSDDVRPYNGFLMQQTFIGKNGLPIYVTPDYQLEESWMTVGETGDSATLYFCIKNAGDALGPLPLYVTVYKEERKQENILLTKAFNVLPTIKGRLCYSLSIKNISTYNIDKILVSVNDQGKFDAKGNGLYFTPECNYDNQTQTKWLLMATVDLVSTNSQAVSFRPLDNDRLGACTVDDPSFSMGIVPGIGLHLGKLSMNTSTKSFTYTPNKSGFGIDSAIYYIKCGTDSSATKLYFLVNNPNALNYYACPGAEVVMGFLPLKDITYNWYTSTIGGTNLGSPNSYTVIKGDPLKDIGTWWVEPVWKGIKFSRIPVILMSGSICGDQVTKEECLLNGTLLFKEDFDNYDNGNNPLSGLYSMVPLPSGRTSYLFFNGVSHPTSNTSTAVFPHDGEYSLQKNRGTHTWLFLDDHTSPNDPKIGRAMLINANEKPGLFYQHTISGLCGGMRLIFSTWCANVNGAANKPDLKFKLINTVDNTVLAVYGTGSLPLPSGSKTNWRQYGFYAELPEGVTDIRLEISNNNFGGNGNDFAMDDIEIRFCAPPVLLKPAVKDTVVCLGAEFKLEGVYTDDGTFGEDLAYVWMKREKDQAIWTEWKKGTITSPLDIKEVLMVQKSEEGYYRLEISNPSNIESLLCRAKSDSIYVEIQEKVIATDIRVKACPNPTQEVDLSKFLYFKDYTNEWTLEWKKKSIHSPDIKDSHKGTIRMDIGEQPHVYQYKVANSCGESSAQLYLTSVNGILPVLPEKVSICKDNAENINLNQIFGLEFGVISVEDNNIIPYLTTPVPPSLFAGATILNGKAVWDSPTIAKTGDVKIVKFIYTVGTNNCFPSGTKFELELIITEDML